MRIGTLRRSSHRHPVAFLGTLQTMYYDCLEVQGILEDVSIKENIQMLINYVFKTRLNITKLQHDFGTTPPIAGWEVQSVQPKSPIPQHWY
jgi:hypothetical protein